MGWTRRRFLLGAAVASGGVLLTGCAEAVAGTPRAAPPATSGRGAPKRDRVIVAVPEGRPYGYEDSTGHSGQTVEVARAVLRNMGIDQVDFILSPFDLLPTLLGARQADLIGGLYIYVGDRRTCNAAEYSVVEHVGLTALGVPPGNPKGLKDLAGAVAAGAKVAVMKDLTEQQYLTRTGAPAGQVTVLNTPDAMVNALAAGQVVDCIAFSDIGLRGMAKDKPGRFEVTPGFQLQGEKPQAAVFATKEEGDLLPAFSEELTKLHRSGEWAKIVEPFGFTKENLPPAGLTAGQLCG